MNVEALCEPIALEWLTEAASNIPAEKGIVECGVHQGSSTVALARRAIAEVHSYDPWGQVPGIYPGRPHMVRRYSSKNERIARDYVYESGVEDRVLLHRLTAVQGARVYVGKPVGLWLLDAEHTYQAVLADYEAWAEHFSDHCLVVFDDYDHKRFPGVVKAVDELVERGDLVVEQMVGRRMIATRYIPQERSSV